MTRQKSDRAKTAARPPDDRWSGRCSRAAAAQLLRFDQHTILRDGRRGVLMTVHWLETPLVEQDEPLEFFVVFTAGGAHPAAPRSIQTLVDGIVLAPVTVAPPAS